METPREAPRFFRRTPAHHSTSHWMQDPLWEKPARESGVRFCAVLAFSRQTSAVSRQPPAASRQPSAVS